MRNVVNLASDICMEPLEVNGIELSAIFLSEVFDPWKLEDLTENFIVPLKTVAQSLQHLLKLHMLNTVTIYYAT